VVNGILLPGFHFMPNRKSTTGSELFIVDNSDTEWKVLRYLHDWCQIAKGIDVATGYFEIGSLLALKDEWQKVDQIRILMGDECSMRTKAAFEEGLNSIEHALDQRHEPAQAVGTARLLRQSLAADLKERLRGVFAIMGRRKGQRITWSLD